MTQKTNGWAATTTIAVALIAALPGMLAGLAAFYKASETHDLVNSRLSEVLPLIKKGAADEATLKEKEAEAMRKGAVDAAKPK